MDIEFNAYFEALEAIARHTKIIKARPHPESGTRLVMIVNEEWIFVFPCAAAGEVALLDLIRVPLSACGVLTPEIELSHDPAAQSPEPTCFAYRMIQGRSLTMADLERATATDIAEGLGRVLSTLHAIRKPDTADASAGTLVHGGLDHKCILVDDTGSRLVGLVGWRQATAAAPAVDLDALRAILGPDLHAHALSAYGNEGDRPYVA